MSKNRKTIWATALALSALACGEAPGDLPVADHAEQRASASDTFTGSLSSSGKSWTTHTFTARAGEALTVRLDWDDPAADFNVFLTDPSGTQVTYANGKTAKPEVVTHTVVRAGTFQVGIKCKSGAGRYTLTIDRGGGSNVQTLFGASFEPGRGTAAYDALNEQLGGMDVRRSFSSLGDGVDKFLNRFQREDIERGVVSAHSFKFMPAEVIAGRHDAALQRFFAGIADGHTVYWTYWHEPDDELYVDRLFTPAEYRAAWRHIRRIADAEKARRPNLQAYATLIIMEWSMTDGVRNQRPLLGENGMYPGDDVIDVFGVDAYNYSSAADKGRITDIPKLYGKIIDFARSRGKPWAIGEIGSCPVAGNPQGRATFLRESIKYWIQRDYPPLYAAYFNLNWPSCDYRLENQPPALEVWRTACTEGLDAFR